MSPNPPIAPPPGSAVAGIELGPAIAPVEAPQAPAKKLYEAPVLKRLGEIEAEKPLTPETAREHLETIAQAKTVEPDHPVETAEQLETINQLFKEINVLLYKIKSPDLLLSHFASKVNGELPLGAEFRQQALELVRKGLKERDEAKHKALLDRIDAIYPEKLERRSGAFVAFLRNHRSQVENLLPPGTNADEYIESAARGQIGYMSLIEGLSQNEELKKELSFGLTGQDSLPVTNQRAMLESADQSDNLLTRNHLKEILNPKEPIPFKQRVMSYGGIGLMLLLMITPMMNEGQPQGH